MSNTTINTLNQSVEGDSQQYSLSLRWGAIIDEIKRMKLLRPDWDGEGAPAPTKKAVNCAELVATVLMAIGSDPADRVFVDQNGCVCMEFIQPDRYVAIEIDRRKNVSFWMARLDHKKE